MAVLNDLVVSGASSLVGPVKANTIQLDSLKIPTTSNGTTYGTGTAGQILKTNGTTVYWDNQVSTYSLPLAANGTRGGVQIGYSENGKNYAVKLSGEKMYVTVPWTNTTYTFATGDAKGQIKVTPSGGSAQNISVKGLGSAAYKNASGTWNISISGNAATATLLAIHNGVTSTTTRRTGASTWRGEISGAQYVWGQAFSDSAIGSDSGDIVLAVRPGVYTSGGTELCVCIDGDYYSMGNKVLHAGNYTDYTVTKTGSGASGTWGINITGRAGSVAWGKVTGKPSTFAPSSHNHAWGDITGKPSTFAPSSHNHAWGDITGKPSTFTPAAHTHASLVTNGTYTSANIDGFIGNGLLQYCTVDGSVTGNDGVVLSLGWSSDNKYGAQMWLDDGGNSGGMKIRNSKGAGSWNPWQTVLTDINYSSYALPLSGGTLSGNVTVQKASGSTIVSVNNTSIGKINLQVSDSGYKGVYDSTHEKWLIYSGSDNITKVPAGQTVSTAAVRNIKIIAPGTAVTPGTTAISTGEVWMRYEN